MKVHFRFRHDFKYLNPFRSKISLFLLIPLRFLQPKKKTIHKNPIRKDAEFTWTHRQPSEKIGAELSVQAGCDVNRHLTNKKIGSNSPGVLDLLGGYGEVVSLKRTYFSHLKPMGFSKGKDWLPLPPIFKGENVSFREAKSESQGFFSW